MLAYFTYGTTKVAVLSQQRSFYCTKAFDQTEAELVQPKCALSGQKVTATNPRRPHSGRIKSKQQQQISFREMLSMWLLFAPRKPKADGDKGRDDVSMPWGVRGRTGQKPELRCDIKVNHDQMLLTFDAPKVAGGRPCTWENLASPPINKNILPSLCPVAFVSWQFLPFVVVNTFIKRKNGGWKRDRRGMYHYFEKCQM